MMAPTPPKMVTLFHLIQSASLACANGEAERARLILEEHVLPRVVELSYICNGGLLEMNDLAKPTDDRIDYADVLFQTLRDALATEQERT